MTLKSGQSSWSSPALVLINRGLSQNVGAHGSLATPADVAARDEPVRSSAHRHPPDRGPCHKGRTLPSGGGNRGSHVITHIPAENSRCNPARIAISTSQLPVSNNAGRSGSMCNENDRNP